MWHCAVRMAHFRSRHPPYPSRELLSKLTLSRLVLRACELLHTNFLFFIFYFLFSGALPTWKLRSSKIAAFLFLFFCEMTQTIGCIWQLGALGDVEIRRHHDGTLMVPKKFQVGTKSIEDLIVSTILSSKHVENAFVQAIRSRKHIIGSEFIVFEHSAHRLDSM